MSFIKFNPSCLEELSAVARFASLFLFGLLTWGLRPRLYAGAGFAGWLLAISTIAKGTEPRAVASGINTQPSSIMVAHHA
jgi:hypothetical protein